MKRALILLILLLTGCQYYNLLEMSQHEIDPDLHQLFTDAFYSPECDNPCWLGIEVGVTRGDEVIPILEAQGVAYGVPGVIHLHSIPTGTVPGIVSDGITIIPNEPPSFGDINVNPYSEDNVLSMDFYLDLCVQTVIDAYGMPEVMFTESGIPSILVYFDNATLFSVNRVTLRIEGIFLHRRDNLPPQTELENWSLYAHRFPDDCTDALTETAGD